MSPPRPRLDRRLPPAAAPLWEPLLAIARNVGVGVTGTRGVGKSSLLFLFAWLDAVIFDKATVIIDPVGQVTNLFLSQVARFAEEDQRAIWAKVRYLNLAGQEPFPGAPLEARLVLPTPVYYAAGVGAESSVAIAERFPEAVVRLEPKLTEATVQGYKALWRTASRAGRILYTLGLGVTEMADLLTFPDHPRWEARFDQALVRDPNLSEAVTYFREEYARWTPGRRDERTNALMTRLTLFDDETMQAQFGGTTVGVPWREVLEQRLTVFVDLSHDHNDEARRFKMLWVFLTLLDFIKRWGPLQGGDRAHPLSLIVDEIAVMAGKGSALTKDLDELINTYSRNYNVHFVTSCQEPYQIDDPKMLDSLLSLGTKFFARMTDPESARLIADRAIPYDPHEVKDVVHYRVGGIRGWDEPRNIYFSKPEQVELGRQRFDNLGRGEFLVSRTVDEGGKPLPLQPFSIAPFIIGPPQRAVADDAKQRLARRDGLRVGDALAAIRARRDEPVQPVAVVSKAPAGIPVSRWEDEP